VHWFIAGGMGGGMGGGGGLPGGTQNGGSSASQQIATWVQETFPSQTIGGVTVYDLTAG